MDEGGAFRLNNGRKGIVSMIIYALILAFSLIANAAANLLLKIAASEPDGKTFWHLHCPSSIFYVLAVMAYAVSFIAYSMSLKRFPLHVAQPVSAGGAIALCASVSWFMGMSSPSTGQAVGIVLIVVGIALLSKGYI